MSKPPPKQQQSLFSAWAVPKPAPAAPVPTPAPAPAPEPAPALAPAPRAPAPAQSPPADRAPAPAASPSGAVSTCAVSAAAASSAWKALLVGGGNQARDSAPHARAAAAQVWPDDKVWAALPLPPHRSNVPGFVFDASAFVSMSTHRADEPSAVLDFIAVGRVTPAAPPTDESLQSVVAAFLPRVIVRPLPLPLLAVDTAIATAQWQRAIDCVAAFAESASLPAGAAHNGAQAVVSVRPRLAALDRTFSLLCEGRRPLHANRAAIEAMVREALVRCVVDDSRLLLPVCSNGAPPARSALSSLSLPLSPSPAKFVSLSACASPVLSDSSLQTLPQQDHSIGESACANPALFIVAPSIDGIASFSAL
jgi:hypothetical protein